MISKRNLLPFIFGSGIGVALIIINMLLSMTSSTSTQTNLGEPVEINYLTIENKEALLETSLRLFGLEKEEEISEKDDTTDLLSEDVTVRIVAQAKVGNTQNTMLEIVSDSETKRIRVQEGSVVNGLLIKSITNKLLVVEKNTIEHSIKLFHPKELNSTITEQSHDIQQ